MTAVPGPPIESAHPPAAGSGPPGAAGPTAATPDTGATVRDLLGRLTLAEKIAMLHQHQPAVERLGLGKFHTGAEALHGVAWIGPATVFPQAVGLGASWDRDLLGRIGEAVSTELRAYHRNPELATGSGQLERPTMVSLNVWAPVVNLLRDPRWGRNEEGYSEDPYATAELATAYCTGLRGPDPYFWRTAPTLKHFLAYNVETLRDTMSVTVPPRVLYEYELPAFRGPILAGVVAGVMPAYNLVNGIPNHVHPLLSQQLRRWRPDLVICSDAQAPSNLVDTERYFADHAESHAAALLAGLDSFTDNGTLSAPTIARFTEAVARGLVTEADIDRAVGRVLAMRCRLGEFHPDRDPYARTGPEVIACAVHGELAARAARESVVLLKNADHALPWTGRGSVAVLGHLADRVLTDWYSGTFPYQRSVADGLRDALGEQAVTVADGVDRVALRAASTGDFVAPGPDGLAASSPLPVPFAHLDWGDGVSTLRAESGRYVRVEQDGRLVDASATPDGWVVRELFELHPTEGGVRLRAPAADRWIGLDEAGRLRADVTDPGAAERFRVDLLRSGAEHAASAAAAADRVVVVLGNDPHINGRETQDRSTLRLPPAQETVLRAAYAANPGTVLLLMSSYPYAIGWAARNLPAVLWMSHGGQETGRAAAEVLLGRYNPAGRLPQTWYADDADLGALDDYDIIGSRLTYLYHPGTPLFPFGHGLSYTTFGYADLAVGADRAAVTVTVRVSNTGDLPGEEVVQLYARAVTPSVPRPLRQLVGFTRVAVPAGESRQVTFEVPRSRLAMWSEPAGGYLVEPGEYEFLVSRSATDPAVAARLVLAPADGPG